MSLQWQLQRNLSPHRKQNAGAGRFSGLRNLAWLCAVCAPITSVSVPGPPDSDTRTTQAPNCCWPGVMRPHMSWTCTGRRAASLSLLASRDDEPPSRPWVPTNSTIHGEQRSRVGAMCARAYVPSWRRPARSPGRRRRRRRRMRRP